MKASAEWLAASGAVYDPGPGRTGTAQLRHYAARYRIWGDGPPLVLVPGLAGGTQLVGPLAQELSRHFQVISYELRGEDDCFALRQRFGLADLASDLHEFLDWFGLEQPDVMGVSFGGVVALELAIRRPSSVGRLLLQGVSPHFEANLLQEVATQVLMRFPLPTDNKFVNQFFNLFLGGRQRPGPLVDFVTRQCWQTDQGVMAHRFRMVEQLDFRHRLANVRTSSLLMVGDRDLLVSMAGLREMATKLPQARTVKLPGCGHFAFVTHAERIAAEVAAFLEPETILSRERRLPA